MLSKSKETAQLRSAQPPPAQHGPTHLRKEFGALPAMGHTCFVVVEELDRLREPLEEVGLAGDHIAHLDLDALE